MSRTDKGSFICPSCRRLVHVTDELGEHVVELDSPFALGGGGEYIMFHWEFCRYAKHKQCKKSRESWKDYFDRANTSRTANVQHDDPMPVVQEIRDDHPRSIWTYQVAGLLLLLIGCCLWIVFRVARYP